MAGRMSMTNSSSSHDSRASVSGLLYLLQVASTTYPTGAFNHSYGFETLVEDGMLESEETLFNVARDWLLYALSPGDGCAVALAHRYAKGRRWADLAVLAALVGQIKLPRETREASEQTGTAFMTATRSCLDGPALEGFSVLVSDGECPCHQAVAFGIAAADAGVAEHDATLAFLHSSISNVVSVAARLIPLGQIATQRILANCWPHIEAGTELARSRDETSMSSACTAVEIAAMRHETQRVRLCMS